MFCDFDEGLFIGTMTLTLHLVGWFCIIALWSSLGIGLYYLIKYIMEAI